MACSLLSFSISASVLLFISVSLLERRQMMKGMIMEDIFEDLGDLLLPNSSNSISWNELELESDGEIRYADDFEQNPVSPTFISNDFGGDGAAEKNARKDEVKGGKFRLELSNKVPESDHRSLDVQRQQWQSFPPVVPNFPDSPSSWSKLALDSDGKIWSGDAFERNPVSPTLISNNNGGDGTVEEISREEKVSPVFIFNNNGGNGSVQENTREEEVKGRKFPLGVSKKVWKSRHLNFGSRRQKLGNFHRVSPNSPLGGGIRWTDDFDRNPLSTTFFLNDNGGKGTVEENTWEDEAPDFSEKAPKSNHWSLACGRQQLYPPMRCIHCLSEKTPQWRAGPMGPKTLCNACGLRYKSGGLSPEYRPAGSPTFDSLKHTNFHRKIARNLIRI